MNKRIRASCVLIAISLVLIIILSVFFFNSTNNPISYVIVINCAKSYSMVILFRIKFNEDIVNQDEVSKCKTEKGIESFPKPNDAIQGLYTCIQSLKEDESINFIQKKDQLKVIVRGSASMKYSNPVKINNLFKTIERELNQLDLNTTARILTEKEEALYTWTSVNYFNQKLMKPGSPTNGIIMIEKWFRLIAYSINNNTNGDIIQLVGNEYKLKLVSDLCTGIKPSFNRYIKMEYFDLKSLGNNEIMLSCLPLGFRIESNEIMLNDMCFKNETPLDSKIKFVGISDYGHCRKMVELLANRENCLEKYDSSLCSIEANPIDVGMSFYTLSSYHYYIQNLVDSNGKIELSRFRSKIQLVFNLNF